MNPVSETGFTPDYGSASGSMVEVQQSIAHLPAADREAIAAYLKAVPARRENQNPRLYRPPQIGRSSPQPCAP